MVRMLIGDYKAMKVVAKSRHMPAIRLSRQFIVMSCSAAIYEDIDHKSAYPMPTS